jgi:Concanavalin A-like lectin/glucanases superfamily
MSARAYAYDGRVRHAWLLAVLGCGRLDFGLFRDPPDAPPAGSDAALDAGLDPSLVAWWRMEAFVGSDGVLGVVDSTGVSQSLAACTEGGNCPTIVPGHIGNAAQFDGTTTILSAASAPPLIDSTFTIGAWFLANSINADGGCVMTKGLGTGMFNSWATCLDTTGTPYFYTCQTSVDDSLPGSAAIALGSWHYIAGTWDGATKNFWLDGAVIATDMPAGIDFDDDPVYIGGDVDNGMQVTLLDGVVDEVRVYNRVLSDAEIAALSAQ